MSNAAPMACLDFVTEVQPHVFSLYASDAGFSAGAWPLEIETSKPLGNGMNFVRVAKKEDQDGELIYVRYDQIAGCTTIRIYND